MNTNNTQSDLRSLQPTIDQTPNETGRTIRKYYKRLRQAESYQTRLYGKYNEVTCTAWPMFSETGWYAWRVASPLGN